MPELPPPAPPVPPPPSADAVHASSCANCGSALAGPFCGQCGQSVADYHRSVWRFLTDFLDNTFCWDNKLLLTLKPLLNQPGYLTQEFMSGRRVRYVHPLRLFLFTSAVCLALIGFINHHSHRKTPIKFSTSAPGKHRSQARAEADDDDEDERTPSTAPVLSVSPAPLPTLPVPSLAPTPVPSGGKELSLAEQIARAVEANTVRVKNAPSTGSPGASSSPVANAESAEPLEKKIGQLVDHADVAVKQAAQTQKRLKNFDVGDAKQMVDSISQGIEQRLSWVGLALLPVFALLLRAVYWREDSYYFSHLVFSLHYHTFLFLFWATWVCADFVLTRMPLSGLWSFLLACCLLLPGWYLYVALRRFYGDSRRRTLTKVFVLGSLHILSILIGVASVGAMAFFSAQK